MRERPPRTKSIMKKELLLMKELPSPQAALAHFMEKSGTVAAARIAASSVLNKLTASLPMRPWRSAKRQEHCRRTYRLWPRRGSSADIATAAAPQRSIFLQLLQRI